MYGNKVSHSQRHTRRRFVVNVQRRHLEINGVRRTVHVCTRCLRTMLKVPKA
jgi:large subunit ribosomal protein L28